jgi:hypothetical protein
MSLLDAQNLINDPGALALGEELLAHWGASFAGNSPAAMALLYSEGSMLYGSKTELFLGSEGAMRYFSGLAPRRSRAVQFTEVAASFAGESVLAVAAIATFLVSDAPALVTRFTQTWVKTDGGWRVISHHASPKKPFPV